MGWHNGELIIEMEIDQGQEWQQWVEQERKNLIKKTKQVIKLKNDDNDDLPLFMKHVSQLDIPIKFPQIIKTEILQGGRMRNPSLRF